MENLARLTYCSACLCAKMELSIPARKIQKEAHRLNWPGVLSMVFPGCYAGLKQIEKGKR